MVRHLSDRLSNPHHGKGVDTETLLGRGRVPEFLSVFVVFCRFLWAPGQVSLPRWPYFRVCVSVVVFLSTETSHYALHWSMEVPA
jgi:hypothetical protein